ncbi:MAG: dCTP deaminase [Candidatus Bathyarchaeia archaeon]
MALSDFDLRNYIREGRLVIDPIHEDTIRENGVDLRLGNSIARLKSAKALFDVHKKLDIEKFYQRETGESFIINPLERVLVCTQEYVELPTDLMGFMELRSTFARCGLILPPTILDGGFRGNVTMEIMGSSFPVRLYAGDRFAHAVFVKLSSPIGKPYSGRYQGQRGVTLPRFDV